jgi:predicted metal-dependent HD superfamily phosphohydrolase
MHDLGVHHPPHLGEQRGGGERLREEADPRARGGDIAPFVERERGVHIGIERISGRIGIEPPAELGEQLFEQDDVELFFALEIVVEKARGDARLRGHGSDGRATLAMGAEDACEGSCHLRAAPGPNAGATHRLVVSPIYGSHPLGMAAYHPTDLALSLSFECPASLLEHVFARYAEPHRRYHTWTHILACLEARQQITEAALPEVDLALLFHDAIYDPLANDNEVRSARLLVEEGRRAWIDERLLQRAQVLVAATKHGGPSVAETEEACIVADADLSILGSEWATFAEYERTYPPDRIPGIGAVSR